MFLNCYPGIEEGRGTCPVSIWSSVAQGNLSASRSFQTPASIILAHWVILVGAGGNLRVSATPGSSQIPDPVLKTWSSVTCEPPHVCPMLWSLLSLESSWTLAGCIWLETAVQIVRCKMLWVCFFVALGWRSSVKQACPWHTLGTAVLLYESWVRTSQ